MRSGQPKHFRLREAKKSAMANWKISSDPSPLASGVNGQSALPQPGQLVKLTVAVLSVPLSATTLTRKSPTSPQ
jgi:hypothetical protein